MITEVIENTDGIVRIRQANIGISESTIKSHLNVVQVTGIAMEPELVQNSPDPADAVLRRKSTLNRQLNRLKEELDSLRADSVADFADCHSDEKRVARLRVDVGLDAVGPLVVRVEVASHHRVRRGSVSHIVGIVAIVLHIIDEDSPVIGGIAEALSVFANRELASVVDCQEQLVDIGGWGTPGGFAIDGSIAELCVYTLVSYSSRLQFRRTILTGSSSIGYKAMVPQDLLYVDEGGWDCSRFCLLPRLLFSDRAPEREPQQLLLPFLRYRSNGVFNGNPVVGTCLGLLYLRSIVN